MPLPKLHARILSEIRKAGLEFPGLDDQAILDRVVPTAEDWIVMKIVQNCLSSDDQAFFRDAYLSAPDVFDPVEFLSDTVPDFDNQVEAYFEQWLSDFGDNLSNNS